LRLPTTAATRSHRPESAGSLIFIFKIFLVSTNWSASFVIITWLQPSTLRFSTSLKEVKKLLKNRHHQRRQTNLIGSTKIKKF
jgi:hypothetical protein